MVGATRQFIAKPMDVRAIVNGLSAHYCYCAFIWVDSWAENLIPQLKAIQNKYLQLIIVWQYDFNRRWHFLFSTHRSVLKYLRMKLDDLY